MTLLEEMREFIMAFFNVTLAQAITWGNKARNGVRQIFIVSFGISLALILIGFGINGAEIDGSWLITTGSIISFVSLIIALFVFMGPAWGILLVTPKTSETAQEFFKKYILSIIMWASLVNISFLIFPTTNWVLSDAVIFIFAVIVAALTSIILNKETKLVYQIAFSIGIIIILILIGKMIFPTTVQNINHHLLIPANQQITWLTQTWWGALAVIVSLFFVIPWLINFVRRINGEEKKGKSVVGPKEKIKKKIWPGIKTIGSTIFTIAFFFIFLTFVWWGVSKMQPTWTANVSQIAGASWEKGKKAVDKIQKTDYPTPPPTVKPANKKMGYMTQNGNITLFVTKRDGVTIPAGQYLIKVLDGQVRWTYNKNKFKKLNNGQKLTLTSTASFFAVGERAKFQAQKK